MSREGKERVGRTGTNRLAAWHLPAPPREAGIRPAGASPWHTHVRVFAVVLSLFVHMAVILAAAMVIVSTGESGGSESGEVGLAVVSDGQLTELAEAGLAEGQPGMMDAPIEEGFSVDDLPTLSADSLLGSAGGSGLSELPGIGAGSGGLGGDGSGLGIGSGGGSARFFGVEAQGSRFAYIVDVSGSMGVAVGGGTGTRLDNMKAELMSSIGGLLEHMHFTIVFYNAEALPLLGNKWFAARERTKKEFSGLILEQIALGGTNPLPAFRIVFDLKPRPDAIYFMTDGAFGGLTQEVIESVARWNRSGSKRTPIHCITFDNNEAEDVMRRIAEESGGSYKHVGAPGGSTR